MTFCAMFVVVRRLCRVWVSECGWLFLLANKKVVATSIEDENDIRRGFIITWR